MRYNVRGFDAFALSEVSDLWINQIYGGPITDPEVRANSAQQLTSLNRFVSFSTAMSTKHPLSDSEGVGGSKRTRVSVIGDLSDRDHTEQNEIVNSKYSDLKEGSTPHLDDLLSKIVTYCDQMDQQYVNDKTCQVLIRAGRRTWAGAS
jgi:hypothetical protein